MDMNKLANDLANIYNAQMNIETKGQSTDIMTDSRRLLLTKIQEVKNEARLQEKIKKESIKDDNEQ